MQRSVFVQWSSFIFKNLFQNHGWGFLLRFLWVEGDVHSLLPKSLTAGGQTKDVCFSNAQWEGFKPLGGKKICNINSDSLPLLTWICAVAAILAWADAGEIILTSFFRRVF